MPRGRAENNNAGNNARRLAPRLVLWSLAGLFVMSGVIWGVQQFENFLISDARFVLPPPADYGQESPNLHVNGVVFANRSQVLRVFANDIGRSVFLLPLADRRRALLRVSWVKDASIVRLWPNRVIVNIAEREPAAFIGVETEGITRWSLIDADGVILDPTERPHQFNLPILRGVRADDRPAMRGTRVRRMQYLLKELGPLAGDVSEIDAANLDNLKVTEKMQDHATKLILGDRNFRSRLQNFLDHYPDIRKRMPDAKVLDLRLDDRITVVEEARNAS